MTSLYLFEELAPNERERLGDQAYVLRGFALPFVNELLPAITQIASLSPFRQMQTPGGYTMSVALTNCGKLGWVTDRSGYRYSRIDPQHSQPWPAMPQSFTQLARTAAAEAGFPDFEPDACLLNRYLPSSRMSLHQDKNERDFSAPIVSVSLGMTATFLFGGHQRSDRTAKVVLHHGDVVVWGGLDRMRYHGIMPLKGLAHPLLGEQRINFTFRKAG
ncbi:DNA oxidative demethylase AlkB [Pusillimonas sp. CC-YST705]|uniref:DNA oxidative demethylase AlkB n=1 Tax=Mesopusillimonas faecipullorum TaxID=2755040 RepID=A0ABS8CG55_9BURK|nr:DNA oxidative demethylase AlkB [Mesopusillimonas faecipullorum]MCB5364789.1 DNA oxidative demethylase AlkB [Mesopusillimonas faecipullorum]